MRRRQHVAEAVAKRIEEELKSHSDGHSPEVPIRAMAGKAKWESSWQQGLSESAVPEAVGLKPVSPDSRDGVAKVRFNPFDVKKGCSRLVQAAKWTRLLRTIALGDATAEPQFGADPVCDKLCDRLREHKAAKTEALKELKAFEGIIVFCLFRDDPARRLDADHVEVHKVMSPDLPRDKRSKPPLVLPAACPPCWPCWWCHTRHRPVK